MDTVAVAEDEHARCWCGGGHRHPKELCCTTTAKRNHTRDEDGSAGDGKTGEDDEEDEEESEPTREATLA
jgi:hypothetical protein